MCVEVHFHLPQSNPAAAQVNQQESTKSFLKMPPYFFLSSLETYGLWRFFGIPKMLGE